MFTKTICTPGAPITIVPEGLLAVLKYNSNGQLECIQLGYDPMNYQVASDEVFSSVKLHRIAPLNISLTGGTTYVYGLFYCEDDIVASGMLPTCIRDLLLKGIVDTPDKFKFLASHPTSLAANFRSTLAIRNWLEMNGFDKLPVLVAPDKVSDETVLELLNKRFRQYRWPIMSGYWIEKSGKQKFIPSGLSQYKIKKVSSNIESNGSVTGVIKFDNDEVMVVPWSQVIDFDLSNDITILMENEKIVASRRHTSKMRNPLSREYVCPECGKKQIIEYNQGIVECEDPHCISRLYVSVCQFLKVLQLPELDYKEYKKYVADKQITCLPDILLLKPYNESLIRCTFPKLLQALVSPFDIPQPSIFQKFADACSNTMKTIEYYIKNPSHIYYDLHIDSPLLPKLVRWLEDPYNVLMLDTFLQTNQLEIVFSGKRFEGAPIFRGKKICVTGEFLHGSLQEIISILMSYDASVSSAFVDSAHCVIVGGTHTNIDGGMIQAARQTGIPVFEETEFFREYEIDADLNANLQ